MIKLDIVLQGPCSSVTQEIISTYKDLEFVDNIIVSSYKNTICFEIPDYVQWVENDYVNPPGTGNRNLHINSSINGMNKVQNKYSVKMRTDQLISKDSMNMMYNYWVTNDDPESRPVLANSPKGRIYVLGLYTRYPYHPRDHLFWGFTEDIKKLVNIPFDLNPDQSDNYSQKVRAETWFGQFYYAMYDQSIYEHINNPFAFTVDGAIFHSIAMQKDWAIRDRLFKVFPRISMKWPKHGLEEYHYHVGRELSEYWAD